MIKFRQEKITTSLSDCACVGTTGGVSSLTRFVFDNRFSLTLLLLIECFGIGSRTSYF